MSRVVNKIQSMMKEPIIFEQKFKNIASYLMNNCSLNVNSELYTITELEFYYLDKENHNDPYVHGVNKQKEFGTFYVHKQNGNYGGIDFTIGNNKKNIYGGILFRGLRDSNNKFITGPNTLKKEIYNVLNVFNYKDLQELIDEKTEIICIEEDKNLKNEVVNYSTRIGLKPSYKDYLNEDNFIYKLYRFTIYNTLTEHKCPEKTNLKNYTQMNLLY